MVESFISQRQLFRRKNQAAEMQRSMVQWLRSAQVALGWAVILLIAGAGIGVYMHRTSQISIIGRSAEQMYIELDALRFENALRRQAISNEQEIYRMLSKSTDSAGNSQFIAPEAGESVYLIVEIPREPAPIPAAPPAPPAPPETIGEVLWLMLTDSVRSLGQGISTSQGADSGG